MAPRDRTTALKLIDRIKQHEMETIGAELAALRSAEKLLEDQSAKLRDDAYNEAKQSTEDTRIFLPGYLKSVETRQLGIAKELTVAAEKTASAEKELLKSFQEFKTTQQVLERLSSELALEEERTITAQMDDAGRTLFLLKRNGQTEGQG
jgi:hypothetical protein